MNNKKLLFGLVIALLTVGVAVFYFNQKPSGTTNSSENSQVTDSKSGQQDVPFGELPKAFPKTLPIPAGSKVLQNFTATADGTLQSTRHMSTPQTLDQTISTYSTYFQSEGWQEISSKQVNANTKTLLLKRKEDTVLVVARYSPATKENSVEISLTEIKR